MTKREMITTAIFCFGMAALAFVGAWLLYFLVK